MHKPLLPLYIILFHFIFGSSNVYSQMISTNTGLYATSSGEGAPWFDPEKSHNPNGDGAHAYIQSASDLICQQTLFLCNHTNRLNITNFRFNIPASATITGLKLLVIAYSNGTGAAFVSDSAVYLVHDNDEISENRAKLFGEGIWFGDGKRKYGSSDDLWGATLTPDIVNDRTFGVSIGVQYTYFSYSITVFVDDVVLKVFYTDSSGQKFSTVNGQAGDAYFSTLANPFNQQLGLVMSSDNDDPVRISVFSNLGVLQFQMQWPSGELPSSIIIPSAKWQSGLYWVEMTEGANVNRKLVMKVD